MTQPGPIIVFATQLGAVTLSDSERPTSWIQVALVGDFEDRRYGKFSITKDHLRQMQENFASGKFPEPPTEIPVDYDHLTLKSTDEMRPGDGKAAGWFKALELRTDDTELWALVEWTPDAADAIKAGEYRFVSPAYTKKFKTLKGDEIGCTLISAAITNTPALQGMAPVTLRSGAASIALAVMGDNDKRTRVDAAIRQQFGPAYEHWDCYLVDIFESQAVFYKRGQYYQVVFSIADDGTVSFDGDPVEVVVQYAPLGASGASLMSNPKNLITLRASDGKDVQIDTAALEETPLVKELRAKLPKETDTVVAKATFDELNRNVATLTSQVTSLTATVTTEKERADKSELQLNTDRANTKVAKLIADGKLTPAQKEWAEKYALTNATEFDAFAGTLQPVIKLGQPYGSGTAPIAGAAGDANAQLEAKAKELKAADSKLSDEAAYALACERNPQLYALASTVTNARGDDQAAA